MGQITIDYETITENYRQVVIALEYQRKFKRLYNRLIAMDVEIQKISTDQDFTDIPVSIKSALNKNWQLIKNYISDVESDADITELLNR